MSALIRRDDHRLACAIEPAGELLKSEALEIAALVGRVVNADENATAVEAQARLRAALDLFERARTEAKKPVLDLGRAIDGTIAAFVEDLKAEHLRITKLVGDFQALELAKARDAEAARKRDLDELERQKRAEMSQAETHEEREAIQARHEEAARSVPVYTPATVKGQIVQEEWEVEVFDIHALYRAHPVCVKLEVLTSQVKALLNTGSHVAGVRAKKVVKATTRARREVALELGA